MTIEVINHDITTEAGWNEYLVWSCQQTANSAQEDERKITDVSLLVSLDPDTSKPFESPRMMVIGTMFHGTDEEVEAQKNGFQMLARSAAVAYKAIASITTTEAWISVQPIEQPRTAPRHDPNHLDALVLWISHRTFGRHTRTAIITTVDGKRSIEPWVTGPAQSGRMADFVPPGSMAEDPRAIALAKTYLNLNANKMMRMFTSSDTPKS